MPNKKTAPAGSIVWQDLTVKNADEVRGFYREVVGWNVSPIDMGGYDDYAMVPDGKRKAVAGICHARGSNAALPPQWLIYITVASVRKAARSCVKLGGEVLDGPRKMGGHGFCVIRDPAGAVAALIEG